MVQAVTLKHRHPCLWALLVHGFVDLWLAARIARACGRLSWAACLDLDDDIAASVSEMPPGRLLAMVEGRVLAALEAVEADQRRRDAKDRRGVWVEQSDSGVASLAAVLEAGDARFVDAAVNRLAGILARGGSTESLNARRALALGVLASPGRALQMMQADLCDELDALVSDDGQTLVAEDGSISGGLDITCPARGQRGHTCGTVTVDPEKLLPKSVLYVHVAQDSLKDASGVVRPEGLKPQLVTWLKDLLAGTKVRVTPVIDTPGMAAVDSYEVPDRMREAVNLRNPFGAVPWSRHRSWRMQTDHTVSFDHGTPPVEGPLGRPGRQAPPGQTGPDNLGPLSTLWHRAKTHGNFGMEQFRPGIFLWTSRLGQQAIVTPSGSIRLGLAA